ncbi:MAG: AAA family ATPase [Succinivibrio sp.]
MFTVDLKKVFNNDNICIGECELEPCNLIDHIPQADDKYVFELNVLNEILLYLIYPFKDCLYISGPSGCGKTTIVLQIASRLNWGVEQITLSNKCESLDLIGHTTLKKGELVYEYGPLTRAMMYGEILILNEIDLMSPGDLSVLNDVLEGKPLTILANNGEIIKPHPQFRVIATANTKGYGDMTGFYNGARLLNQAFLDRFRYIEMNYPKPVVELEMLKGSFPNLKEEMRKKLLHLAHDLRQVVTLGLENGVRQISAPFSTRTLLKIASLVSVDSGYSVHKIVKMCYALRLPEVEAEYVMRLCNDIFGHEKSVLKKTQKNDLNESCEVIEPENEGKDLNEKKAVRTRRKTRSRGTEEKIA